LNSTLSLTPADHWTKVVPRLSTEQLLIRRGLVTTAEPTLKGAMRSASLTKDLLVDILTRRHVPYRFDGYAPTSRLDVHAGVKATTIRSPPARPLQRTELRPAD